MSLAEMSAYERRAYAVLTKPRQGGGTILPERVRRAASEVAERVASTAARVPGAEKIEEIYGQAIKGLGDWTTGVGVHSVSVDKTLERYRRRGYDVRSAEDLRTLDLQQCDDGVPSRKRLHEAVAVVEGVAVSIPITGAVVSTTVSGGATATVALGAVALDSVAVLTGLGRVVGEVATNYGYDPSSPEEELFALQVLGLGLAVGTTARAQALASLSRLTQEMMRRATWTQLERHVLVKVIQRAFAGLGLRLTHRKLAQIVPVAGVAVSAGTNLRLVDAMHKAAQDAYRLRFLTEKYRLDDTGVVTVYEGPQGAPDSEATVSIDEMLAQAVAENLAAKD